jgi:hypothetical protein
MPINLTSCIGPEYKCKRDITKDDIIYLCELVSCKLNVLIRPAKFDDCGLEWVDDNGNPYKCIRFYQSWCDKYKNIEYLKIPIEYNYSFDNWKNNNNIIYRKDMVLNTLMKSYSCYKHNNKKIHKKTHFTLKELKIISSCFNIINIDRYSKYPPRSDLFNNYLI